LYSDSGSEGEGL